MKHASYRTNTSINVKLTWIKSVCLSLPVSAILLFTTHMHWLTFALSSVLILFISIFLYLNQYKKLISYLWEMTCACLGLFIGFYLDFGITDLHVLHELCREGNMLAIAPITVIGMLVGCNLGILISNKPSKNLSHRLLNLLSLNLGMLVGMFVFGQLNNLIGLHHTQLSIFIHLFSMIFVGHIFYLLAISMSYKITKRQHPH